MIKHFIVLLAFLMTIGSQASAIGYSQELAQGYLHQ